jgi:hypothetical protein
MIKPVKAVEGGYGQGHDDELVKKQRKLVVTSLVKDFYPYKFSAGQLIQKREEEKTRDR